MHVKLLLLLAATATAQVSNSNWLIGTADFSYQLSLAGNLLTVWIQKNAPGWLAFGFGNSTEAGDIFVIQSNGGTLNIQSCVLAGQPMPTCGGNLWVLVNSNVNANGSWSAQVTRDISQTAGNVTIQPNAVNNILYYYGSGDAMDIGQNNPADMFGTLSSYVGLNIPTDTTTASPFNTTTNNTGVPDSNTTFGATPDANTTNTTTTTTTTTNTSTTNTTTSNGTTTNTTTNTTSTNTTTNTSTNPNNTTPNTTTSTTTVQNANGTVTTYTSNANGTTTIVTRGDNSPTYTTLTNPNGSFNSSWTTYPNGTVVYTGSNNNNGQNGFAPSLKSISVTSLALFVCFFSY